MGGRSTTSRRYARFANNSSTACETLKPTGIRGSRGDWIVDIDNIGFMNRHRLIRGTGWLACLLLVAFGAFALQGAIETSRSVARHVDCLGHLSQIRLALLQYEADNGHLPPAVFHAGDGRHPHSWRVLLLPYLSRADLYDLYNFDEPWAGPGNRLLIERMPSAYALSNAEARSGRSGVVAVIGEDTVFGTAAPTLPAKDVVVLIEAEIDAPPWTLPKDITKDELIDFSRRGELSLLSHSGYRLAVLSLGPTPRALGFALDQSPEAIDAAVTSHGE